MGKPRLALMIEPLVSFALLSIKISLACNNCVGRRLPIAPPGRMPYAPTSDFPFRCFAPFAFFAANLALPIPISSPPLKHFAGAHGPLRGDALLVQLLAADGVVQHHGLVDDLQYGDIRFAADFEAADTVLPADRSSGVDRALGDNLSRSSSLAART